MNRYKLLRNGMIVIGTGSIAYYLVSLVFAMLDHLSRSFII